MKLLIRDTKLTLSMIHFEHWLGFFLSFLIGMQLISLFWSTPPIKQSVFQALQQSQEVRQQLNESNFEFFVYGTSNAIETDHHYYYDLSETYSFYIRSENLEKDNYFGDLLMTFPQGEYENNYFSHGAFDHSNQMSASQDLLVQFGSSMVFDLYKAGSLFQSFNLSNPLPLHYGFNDFNFLETKSLIVLSFNLSVFENLSANEKNAHLVFADLNDTSTSNMFGVNQIGYKNTEEIDGLNPFKDNENDITVQFLPSMKSQLDNFYWNSLQAFGQSSIFLFSLFYVLFTLIPFHFYRQKVLFNRFRFDFSRLWFSSAFVHWFTIKETVMISILFMFLIAFLTALPHLIMFGLSLFIILMSLGLLSSFLNTLVFYTFIRSIKNN
jgi:hypothetical protein